MPSSTPGSGPRRSANTRSVCFASMPLGSSSKALMWPRRVSLIVIAAINKAIVNVPRDRVRLHVCWGNYEGPHDRDVPLADILPLLEQANVGGFVLPFANPRHQHEYRVLQKFPLADDQIIAAGVIDLPAWAGSPKTWCGLNLRRWPRAPG